jgi:hypothetical protein
LRLPSLLHTSTNRSIDTPTIRLTSHTVFVPRSIDGRHCARAGAHWRVNISQLVRNIVHAPNLSRSEASRWRPQRTLTLWSLTDESAINYRFLRPTKHHQWLLWHGVTSLVLMTTSHCMSVNSALIILCWVCASRFQGTTELIAKGSCVWGDTSYLTLLLTTHRHTQTLLLNLVVTY